MAQRRQVLIVEDNEVNREILREILSAEYQVLEAENGQEALEILRQHKDRISVILLDVIMPVMDGFAFLNHVQQDPDMALIPVIVMTQSDNEESEVAALRHGAMDFVPKPYRPQIILHRMANLIKLRETAAVVNQFQYDHLTGLYSKEFFYEKVREQLDEHPEKSYAIVCSDIENFKLYNDTFGREAGDRLLRETTAAMRRILGDDAICGRYGADCFLCLREQEQERMDRELFFGKGLLEAPQRAKNIVVQWGIYEISDRSIPVEKMCDRALLAAKSVKGQYNHPYAVYDDALREKLLREKQLTDAMETAIAEKQFTVYLQPKYDLQHNRLAGAEALVRWIHPEWGFLSPGEFIPLFEKNGFIPLLDECVWEQVCALLHQWQERGEHLLPVSVNVSRADMYLSDLPDTLEGLTKKYEIDPAYLHLEVTETAYAENPGQIVSTVAELRKRGFVVELDDFGSGYSSLSMLSEMAVDILKLDMRFIRSELAKSPKQSILNDVVAMAHRMGLRVVAEGMETREQMNRLQAVGCDYGQGYFLAKPMPVPDFETLWKTQRFADEAEADMEETASAPCAPGVYTLLVADEDSAYRGKVCRELGETYRVLEAANAADAIALLRSPKEGVRALILSMTLPENGAAALLRTMRQEAIWEVPVLATIPNGEMIQDPTMVMETDDFLCKCHPLFDLQRRVRRLLDIAEALERERALKNEASRDFLTGLLNRRGLQGALDALRADELPLAYCIFDLDDLKKINDTWGHDAGDRVLRAFAELLCRKTRGEDIQCRYGGDEFVLVLKRFGDAETVMRKCGDICRTFRTYLESEGLPSACSGGIALCPAGEKPAVRLAERADQALYRAKREGKGKCCLWSEA